MTHDLQSTLGMVLFGFETTGVTFKDFRSLPAMSHEERAKWASVICTREVGPGGEVLSVELWLKKTFDGQGNHARSL